MTIGFIGLGSQGGPMAAALITAGHDVMLWARRAESLDPYRTSKACFADSVADLGAQCETVAICVVDDAGVEQVCAELFPVMKPGGIIVIHSTIHPKSCVALAKQAQLFGLTLVDAPVSGGGSAASAKTLTVMLGGSDEAVAALKPLLEAFAGLIVHLGGVGAGQNAKLINNALMAANMANAHNALCSADALGIDRAVLAQLVAVSSGRSMGFDICARQPSLASFIHGAKLLSKDVRLLSETLEGNPFAEALGDTARTYLNAVEDAAEATQ
jgi:3-hydroxyisobutyrate dehydrogenase